ncbi:hypothetical protein BDB00DRAFT_776526 [Zychaea mexicana]|uniref:uncharacterized protein n=1 Tax=Zychaea mexicana TaxID=64656 RepID=UPI0022FE31F9|nr:uncharacterized protein BDB00DRAFT_776526 [Zychaea mexicana]KAI9472927.1 hypothetical protein BDB00DRAFT_776526 [Zychaea mexicana]
MDYWLQRCSICFDAQLDLCLEYCRDQYCLDCFRRYVTEVVTTSWGLSVTKIRCPVCQDHIPQSEWSKFVPSSVVELYNRYNQPYRSFSRCCPSCETEVTPLLPIIERQEWNSSSLPALYRRTLLAVRAFERSHHHHRHAITAAPAAVAPATTESQAQTTILSPSSATAVHPWSHRPLATPITATTATSAALAISKSMLLFDMKPDTWRKLQFQHISFFPIIDCPACLVTFCLQCGQREHPNATCEESMQRTVDSNHRGLPSEAIETLRWQLQNSRRCPNCSIMINRDEGCNKVDCSLCGFCFCWACRSPWSETELGVPNVSSIQARLFPLTGAP